ncbi:MAG: hypothetical protein FWF49_04800 [Oscillospiraceae bacterium]|nr:hypothetical protein [Oscillospiraceae bacterium]
MPQRSEAYDLSLFEEKKPSLTPLKPNKKLEKATRHKRTAQSVLSSAAAVMVAVIAIAVFGSMLATRAQLVELNKQNLQKQAQLGDLTNEYQQLDALLASYTTAQSIADYAAANGMTKIDPSQITYITISSGDSVSLASLSGNHWYDGFGAGVSNFFGKLAALFG